MRFHHFAPLLISTLVALASSCKKEEDPKPLPLNDIVYPLYSHHDSGAYWVYALYRVDTNGVATPTGDTDSCYVEKDTIIRGQTWHKYFDGAHGEPGASFLRDSLDYIVDVRGNIYFAASDFTTIFLRRHLLDRDHLISPVPVDTVALVERKMADRIKTVNVPAGTFVTSSMRLTWTFNDTLRRAGYPGIRVQDTRYSAAVGKVSETLSFYISDPTYVERRLLRYHIR